MSIWAQKVNGGYSVTLLRKVGEDATGKSATWNPASETWILAENPYGLRFNARVIPIRNLRDLYRVLAVAAPQNNLAVILERPNDAVKPTRRWSTPMRRQMSEADKKPLIEQPRPYLAIDFDATDCTAEDGPTVAAHLRSLLPPAFHRAACAWNLTGSHILKSGKARARLWFWLDRPIDKEQSKQLVCELGLVDGRPQEVKQVAVDESLYDKARLHFINTQVIGAEDPFPKRWGMLDGDVVHVPEPAWFAEQAQLNSMLNGAKTRALAAIGDDVKDTAKRFKYPLNADVAYVIDIMGDGFTEDGRKRDGYYFPAFRIINLTVRHCERTNTPVDVEALEAVIAAAIKAAPAGPGRAREVKEHLRKIRSKIDYVLKQNRLEAVEKRKNARTPALADPVTLADAERIVRDAVRAALGTDYTPRVRPQPTPDCGFMPVDDEDLDGDLEPSSNTSVIAVTTGVGKTEQLGAVLAELQAAKPGRRYVIVVPTHNLAEEMQQRLAGYGVRADVWLGVEQPNPLDPGRHACETLNVVKNGFKIGLTLKAICSGCPFRKTCFYRSQDLRGSSVIITAGAAYLSARPEQWGDGFHAMIIDETSLEAFTAPLVVRAGPTGPTQQAELQFAPDEFDWEPQIDLPPKVLDALKSSLEKIRLLKPLFSTHKGEATYEELAALAPAGTWSFVAKTLRGCIPSPSSLMPRLREKYRNDPDAVMLPEEWHCLRVVKFARLAEVLALVMEDKDDPAVTSPFTPRIRIWPDRLEALGRRQVQAHWRQLPKLILDATADPELLTLCFGKLKAVTVARVEPQAGVTMRQVLHPFSYRFLGLSAGSSGSDVTRRRQQVRTFVKGLAFGQPGRVGVIAPKGLVRPVDERGEPMEGLFDGLPVMTAWHKNLRGLDAMRNVAHLVVISRPLPALPLVERLAESLTGRLITPATKWSKAPVWRRTTQGLELAEVEAHPDPAAEMIRRAIVDAELGQAVGRCRYSRRDSLRPVTIWLLTDVVLNELAAETVSLDQWQSRDASPVMAAVRAGMVPRRKSRAVAFGAVSGLKAEGLRDHLQALKPAAFGTVENWMSGESSVVDFLGGQPWQAIIGTAETRWIILPTGCEETDGARLRAVIGEDCETVRRLV